MEGIYEQTKFINRLNLSTDNSYQGNYESSEKKRNQINKGNQCNQGNQGK